MNDKTEQVLLTELVDGRWTIMYVLADMAEEAGDTDIANGWRWLARNYKWPNSALDRNRYSDTRLYRWAFNIDKIYSHSLPFDLFKKKLLSSTADVNLARLLQKTAKAIGIWLKMLEEKINARL